MKHFLASTVCVTALIAGASVPAWAEDGVEVMHWWTSGGEAAAVQVLKDSLEAQGFPWQDMAVAGGGGDAARTTLRARVVAGDPPTAAQLLGMQVTEWAQEGFLGNLNDVASQNGWSDVVPAAVQGFGVHDGQWVAAPVNVHRPNWLWMNREVFESNNLDVPTSWEEFNTVATQLQDLGIIPLAHGGQPWQDATVFDDVVLGLGGADFYRSAILELDEDALLSDTMVAVFDQMRKIRGFVDDNMSGRDWNLATAMVIRGEAAMQLMGDWAKGEITAAGLTPGEQIMCATAPGTEGSFLFNTDFFAMFDVDTDNAEAQQALAAGILDPDFQVAFNLVKGSIPARTDVDPSAFDVCGQKSIADMQQAADDGTLLGSLAHGHGQPSAVQGAIVDVVTQHFNSDMSSQEAVDLLVTSIQAAQ
ncbi:MAG: ABC transporter substrate-binding protein [Pseudomonadota bacterium]